MQKNQLTPDIEVIVEPDGTQSIGTSEVYSVDTSENGLSSGKTRFVRASQRLGKYQILAELGRGGAASVSLAVTRGKGGVRKLVVLKALLPELAEEVEAVAAFLDEARLAAQLSHPNVVQTYEVGTESGRHVIVMEYLDGQSLSRIARTAQKAGKAFPLALQLRIIVEVLEGLHYAHEMKAYDGHLLRLVHRDVSPQNVIVTYDGQVKILDFGIAKAATSSTHTAAGIMKGKIAYMSPEQMAGTAVDRRADVYSAGCMLWAAAAGARLWQDWPDVQIVRAVVAGKIPSPKSLNPACDNELDGIVMRAMHPDPEKRYATALEFQNALERYLETLGITTKPRELGRYVSQLFAAFRLEFNENVERELAVLLSADDEDSGPESQIERIAQRSVVSPRAQRDAAGSASYRFDAPRRPSRRLTYTVSAIAGVVTMTLFSATLKRSQHSSTRHDTAAAISTLRPSVTEGGQSAQPVADVHLVVSPPGARLLLDGRALDPGITELTLPVGEANHEATVEADGFVREVHAFKVNGPTTLTISLAPSPDRKTTKPLRHRASATNRTATSATAAAGATVATTSPPATKAAAPSCENPFFVDAQGIKRVRSDCL